MNAAGVGFASVIGLLAVFLYINQTANVSDKQNEVQSEIRCRTAKFDADFARRWKDNPEIIKRLEGKEGVECNASQVSKENSSINEEKRAHELKDVQDTIGNMMK
jgi:hypothetical protein